MREALFFPNVWRRCVYYTIFQTASATGNLQCNASVCLYKHSAFFYLYTDYTNYTDYTPYTINPGESAENRIPTRMIHIINKQTWSMLQAQSCNPAEYGGKRAASGRDLHKESEPVISDKLACST